MDQKESQVGKDIENTRAVMAEKIEMIEDRVHETMEGTKSTIDNVMGKVKGVQGTIDDAKSTIDDLLETIKQTMEETIVRVKYTANLIEQVDQNPWIMFGSAILTGYVLSNLNRGRPPSQLHAHEQRRKMMETIEKSVEIHVPLHTAYNQWTQFEEFPRFMEGVESVKQLDDTRLHWVANVGGERKEWDARITEQIPDQHIAWRSEGGEFTRGMVSFQPLGSGETRVTVQLNYEPKAVTEKIGDMLGVVSRRVEGDLERFKDFIESRGHETGGWRGTVR
ncbi:MAG: SRPBCC family protein [Candidatus Entotheonellia bacterium]